MRKLTHEEFMKKFYEKNKHAKDIEILGTYVTAKTKIKCKCKIDGYEWEVVPNDLLIKGTGCPKCAGLVKKTHKQFIEELQEINPDIEVLGTYKNARTKILCKCKIDGYEWETKPFNLLQGQGCRKCAGTLKKTHEKFIKEMSIKHHDIEVLGTYKNYRTKVKVKCLIDGYEWETTPKTLLRGTGCGCPVCAIRKETQKKTKTHEQFIKELAQINQDIEVIGTYVNNHTKIKCRCKIDGYEWEPIPNRLLQGTGCPKCGITKGEKRVAQHLDNLDINYIYNKGYFNDLIAVKGGVMKPDFIIPSLKIWIEYDGEQHFRPVNFKGAMSEQEVQEQFKNTQQNDQIKNQYAQDHNWTLIRIPYWDYDNIEQILDTVLKQEQAI